LMRSKPNARDCTKPLNLQPATGNRFVRLNSLHSPDNFSAPT
jgi:hypothetical protein